MQILLVAMIMFLSPVLSLAEMDAPPSPVYRSLGQMASPGPLSKAHSDLESLDRCGKCHELNVSILDAKCLDCHKLILKMKQQDRGLHAKTKELCIKCHLDHKGAGFDIVGLKKDDFDHKQQTGYVLEGKHKDIKCEKCHNPEHIRDSIIREDQKRRDNTWLVRYDCRSACG